MDKNGICLVGLGPHAKRIYYKYIEQEVLDGKAHFTMLIDLYPKKADIDEFCKCKKVKPEQIVLSKKDDQINPIKLDSLIEEALDKAIIKKQIQYAIISTEPKAHKIYIEYFLKHQIPVLTDKPITAPVGLNYDKKSAKQVYADVQELYTLSEKYKTPLYVLVQRREHPAFQFIFEEATRVALRYNIPITFFDIYHSDGTWSMPGEFYFRENHPYKYGYGKIMHSGYHFIDLVAWIADINKKIFPKLYIANSTKLLKPQTHYRQINGKDLYKRFFDRTTQEPANIGMGEVDSYSSFIFKDGERALEDSNIITYGHLDMLQSGFSKRAWFDLPKDTYKGNGRLRHERLNLHVGPLLNIQLHSYQGEQINKRSGYGAGEEDHLDIYIFRNEKLIGGKSVEILNFGKKMAEEYSKKHSIYLGQNEVSRCIIFKQMLNNQPSKAMIQNQLLTNNILSHMFLSSISDKEEIFKA